MTNLHDFPAWLRLSEEVADALASGLPVVALESTVLAQGLPRPRNLEVGVELERIVRDGGGIPATIAVMHGVPTVGLSADELEQIATTDGVEKRSTRDLPIARARGEMAATTVAATAFIAHHVGIPVFATGGIGGVHRGAPLDASADLLELQRARIIVVCAGAKSILDLPATREALETFGVLVLGWQTANLPAFYARDSNLPVDLQVNDAGEVAAIWRAQREMTSPGALLLCAPIPEEHALDAGTIEAAIERALARAHDEKVLGKAITPYLLREVAAVTAGSSVDANVALLRNNTRIAVAVAREVSNR